MRRFVAIVIVVLLLAGAGGYLVLERAHRAELAAVRGEAEARIEAERRAAVATVRELAEDIARTLAAAVAPAVAAGDRERLDAVAAAAVAGHRIAAVLILDPGGEVVATSDLRFRGRRLGEAWARAALAAQAPTVLDEPATPGQLQAAAPVVSGGARLGAVIVRLDVRRPAS